MIDRAELPVQRKSTLKGRSIMPSLIRTLVIRCRHINADGSPASRRRPASSAGRVVFGIDVRGHRLRSATGSFMSDARIALAAAIAIVGVLAGRVESPHEIPDGSSIHDFSDLA